ncbi:zinc-binding protein A33-like [Mobula hypostoma]|uniref:zinc-binding protein A33-like n=1 Tax=Mobula hypostoma TaxID=723540 RepID=UPI002FC2E4F4
MASKGQVESLTEEVICSICLNFFTDPVILECGHNFCRYCITRYWETAERNSCPECREVFASRTLKVNRALANLSEKARKLNMDPKEKESKLHCEEHEEELKLFCETDKKLLCVICRDAQEHRDHRFLPIKEAVKIYKDKVKSSLDSLTKKKSDIQEMEWQQKEKISGVREQSHGLQSEITSQFAELHQILTQKEQQVLQNVREEEARILHPMEKNLHKIQEDLKLIQEEISKLQEQLDQEDSITFLKDNADRKRRISDENQLLSVTGGTLPIEKFDQPVLYTVWSEMFDAIKRVSVTLDVETAHPGLEVSEDRKSVRWTETRRILPDTGKRFTGRGCVLGSEGFTSRRHYWEVEVTGNRWWYLGVAAESVERKRLVGLSPKTGFWIIGRDDHVINVFTSPVSRLPAGPIPGRVGVYLSYESGTVSFYNAETKFHLHTFTGNKFTGKLYPFFWTWHKKQWLRICSGSSPGTERSFPDTSAPLEDNRGIAGIQRLPGRILNQEVPGVKMASKGQVESWTDEDRVKSALESLTEKKSELEEMERQQKEKISGVREQSHSVQSRITSQFAELRRIMTEKEKHALRDLREEGERILNPMEKNLRQIQENINSIQEEISKLQEQMDHQENVMFLMEEARRERRISDDVHELSVTDGALPVERFYHPYFLNTALRETLDAVNQVSVTLDVETAHPLLEVSGDRKSVRLTGTRRNLPDTGKRFTDRRCVLGSEGFTSGRHYWEVEVTGNRWWSLGVTAESVKRKGGVTLSPETGFWRIGRRDDEMWVHTFPETHLPADPIPGRVGVYLSYDSGTVSFYNAETKSHLHTFTGNKFMEKLHPFFWIGNKNQWLRICAGSAPGL